jgi:DNA-directed RNA polymerase specialized sigma24 family protein
LSEELQPNGNEGLARSGSTGRVREVLLSTQQYADAGEVENLFRALTRSRFLEGLHVKLAGQWGLLTEGDVDLAIAEAVDDLLKAATEGKHIRNVSGFLYRAANCNASDTNRRREREIPIDPVHVERFPDPGPLPDEGIEQGDSLDSMMMEDERYSRALPILRQLVARISTDSERKVWEVLVEAIEAGTACDLEARDIGDMLGLSPTTVRKAKERGLRKLIRLAEEAGFRTAISGIQKTLAEKENVEGAVGDED